MENLIEILQKLHPEIDFTSYDTLIDDGVLDSFDIVSLVADIDNAFDVTIPVEEIVPENFNSATRLYALVSRLADE